jgi:hypothetical protein
LRLAATLALGLAALGTQAFELRGFRGVAWGDSAEALGPATQVDAQGEVTCYRRESENLMFGASALREVRYCFHRDQLFRVDIGTGAGRQALRSEFQRAYGAPSSAGARGVGWGSATRGSARARLVGDAEGATLALYSNRFDPALQPSQAAAVVQRTAWLGR